MNYSTKIWYLVVLHVVCVLVWVFVGFKASELFSYMYSPLEKGTLIYDRLEKETLDVAIEGEEYVVMPEFTLVYMGVCDGKQLWKASFYPNASQYYWGFGDTPMEAVDVAVSKVEKSK